MVRYEPPLGVGGSPAPTNLLSTFGGFLNLLRKNRILGILGAAGPKIGGFDTVPSRFPLEIRIFRRLRRAKPYLLKRLVRAGP